MDFFTNNKNADIESTGDKSNLSEDSGTSVDSKESPIIQKSSSEDKSSLKPEEIKKVLKPEEIKKVLENDESDDSEMESSDNESEHDESGNSSPENQNKIAKDSINSSRCSNSSEDEYYKLDLSSTVYEQSDSDWPIREALIFRLILNIYKLFGCEDF